MTAAQVAQALLILAVLAFPPLLYTLLTSKSKIRKVPVSVIAAATAVVDAVIAVFSGVIYFSQPEHQGGMLGFIWVYLICGGVYICCRARRGDYIR